MLAVGQRTACWALRLLEKFHSTIHCFRDSEDSAQVGWIDDIYIIKRRPTCVISRFTSLLPRLLLAVRGIDVSSLHRIIFYNTATSPALHNANDKYAMKCMKYICYVMCFLTVIKSRARKSSIDGVIIIVRCVFLNLINLILLFHVCKYWLIKFIFMYIGEFFPLYVHAFFNLWYFLIYATGSLCMQYFIKGLNITWVLLITAFSLSFSLFINFIKLQH